MYRDLGDIEIKLLRATLRVGAQESVTGVTAKKVADLCGVSTCTIFNRYGSMRGMLDEAARSFDRPHMELVLKLADEERSAPEIWDEMMDLFMADPDGCLYYISYTDTFGFDPKTQNERAAEFLRIAKVFFRDKKGMTDDDYLLLWDYITSMAFYYAEKFIHFMPYCDANKARIKRLVFAGMDHYDKQWPEPVTT